MSHIPIADLPGVLLDALRACLCTRLADNDAGVCFCSLHFGTYTPAEHCDGCKDGKCGQAWVRLDRIYPSNQFPAQDARASCNAPLAAVIEAGVYRCRPTADRRGGPPDEAATTAATLQEVKDAMLIAQAIACCPEITERPHVLGLWLPHDAGNCGGGKWTVTVRLSQRTTS